MEDQNAAATTTTTAAMKKIFLIINCFILTVGNCGGPLIIHGGKKVWFSCWLETAGWPIILIALLVAYTRRRRSSSSSKLFVMKPRVFLAAAFIGTLTGFDVYMYSYGMSKLPVSTSALVISTQLAFTAGFAFVIVKQKFTAYSVNAVVLLTVGAVVLGLHASGDRPEGESNKEYLMGFVLTLGAAALYGFILPVVELTYKKAKQELTYTLVLEIQLVICIFSTAVCSLGMLLNKDFQGISREAKDYELGETKYYVVVHGHSLAMLFLGINWSHILHLFSLASSSLSNSQLLNYWLFFSTMKNSKLKRVLLSFSLFGVLFLIFMVISSTSR